MKTSAVILSLLILGARASAEDVFHPAAELPGAKGAATTTKATDEAPSLDIPDRGAEKAKASTKSYSGVVNVIRQGERVEVVFRGSDVYYLPHGSKQAAIFDTLSESERTGSSVSITYDARTGVIESASGGGGPAPASAPTPPQALPSIPSFGQAH